MDSERIDSENYLLRPSKASTVEAELDHIHKVLRSLFSVKCPNERATAGVRCGCCSYADGIIEALVYDESGHPLRSEGPSPGADPGTFSTVHDDPGGHIAALPGYDPLTRSVVTNACVHMFGQRECKVCGAHWYGPPTPGTVRASSASDAAPNASVPHDTPSPGAPCRNCGLTYSPKTAYVPCPGAAPTPCTEGSPEKPGTCVDHAVIRGIHFVRKEGRCGGAWTFSNSRMTVATLVSMHKAGETLERLSEWYPGYSVEMVAAAVELPGVVGPMRWAFEDELEPEDLPSSTAAPVTLWIDSSQVEDVRWLCQSGLDTACMNNSPDWRDRATKVLVWLKRSKSDG